MFSSIYKNVVQVFSSANEQDLDKRMRNIVKRCNQSTYHGFKPVVVSLKSKTLLTYINHMSDISEKIKNLELLQDVLLEVGI